jgi:hypothetical protein
MEVNIVDVVYKCHLSEKVGAVCVQTLQVQLHTAVSAKTQTAPAAHSLLPTEDHFVHCLPPKLVEENHPRCSTDPTRCEDTGARVLILGSLTVCTSRTPRPGTRTITHSSATVYDCR